VHREADIVAETCKEEMKCAGSNSIYCRPSFPEREPPKCFPKCTPEDCSEQVIAYINIYSYMYYLNVTYLDAQKGEDIGFGKNCSGAYSGKLTESQISQLWAKGKLLIHATDCTLCRRNS
jgi:hypothetical protein